MCKVKSKKKPAFGWDYYAFFNFSVVHFRFAYFISWAPLQVWVQFYLEMCSMGCLLLYMILYWIVQCMWIPSLRWEMANELYYTICLRSRPPSRENHALGDSGLACMPSISPLNRMLLVASLANTKWCKNPKKNIETLGTHLRVLNESHPVDTSKPGNRCSS